MQIIQKPKPPLPDTYDTPTLCELCENFSYMDSTHCNTCCPQEKTNFAMVSLQKAEEVLNDMYRHGWNDSLRQSYPLREIADPQGIYTLPVKLNFTSACHHKMQDVLIDTYRQGWNDCIRKQKRQWNALRKHRRKA